MISPEVFYLHLDGEQRGPYTIPQIDHLLNSGLIAEETLYWREGLDQWQPVTSLVRLRRRKRNWIQPTIILGLLVPLAVITYFFGSIVLLGWRETNQHDYTEQAAYWRARGVVRYTALPHGAVVEFERFDVDKVTLQAASLATVDLAGEVSDPAGARHKLKWTVPMKFDEAAREWSGGPVKEGTP